MGRGFERVVRKPQAATPFISFGPLTYLIIR